MARGGRPAQRPTRQPQDRRQRPTGDDRAHAGPQPRQDPRHGQARAARPPTLDRYPRLTATGPLQIDGAKTAAEKRFHGKFLLARSARNAGRLGSLSRALRDRRRRRRDVRSSGMRGRRDSALARLGVWRRAVASQRVWSRSGSTDGGRDACCVAGVRRARWSGGSSGAGVRFSDGPFGAVVSRVCRRIEEGYLTAR